MEKKKVLYLFRYSRYFFIYIFFLIVCSFVRSFLSSSPSLCFSLVHTHPGDLNYFYSHPKDRYIIVLPYSSLKRGVALVCSLDLTSVEL